jgi:hypothetical protein
LGTAKLPAAALHSPSLIVHAHPPIPAQLVAAPCLQERCHACRPISDPRAADPQIHQGHSCNYVNVCLSLYDQAPLSRWLHPSSVVVGQTGSSGNAHCTALHCTALLS